MDLMLHWAQPQQAQPVLWFILSFVIKIVVSRQLSSLLAWQIAVCLGLLAYSGSQGWCN